MAASLPWICGTTAAGGDTPWVVVQLPQRLGEQLPLSRGSVTAVLWGHEQATRPADTANRLGPLTRPQMARPSALGGPGEGFR
jgi:hypothetical protein